MAEPDEVLLLQVEDSLGQLVGDAHAGPLVDGMAGLAQRPGFATKHLKQEAQADDQVVQGVDPIKVFYLNDRPSQILLPRKLLKNLFNSCF
jgi:hypothetical protein